MSQSSHSAKTALPAAPLFASSWMAFFSLIMARLEQQREVVPQNTDQEPAGHSH
jgi:hypothetical protein